MVDAEKVQEYVERLKQASTRAIGSGEYTRGVELANAARVLQEWQEQGMLTEMPVDAADLLGEKVIETPAGNGVAETPIESEAVEAPAEEEVAEPFLSTMETEPEKSREGRSLDVPESREDRNLRDLLEEAQSKAQSMHYIEAEADLQTIIERTESTSLRQDAKKTLADIKRAREERLLELVREAERAERQEAGNLERQQVAWQAVQRLDPTHSKALSALARLAERQRIEEQRRSIEALRKPLRDVHKDLEAVEKARLEANEMILSEEIADPDLRRRVEETYQKLDELRDEILRASEGGASSERAQDFEKAVEKYRAALRSGFQVIQDDTDGTYINVAERLERTLQAYWIDLRERSSRRCNEAQRALEDGYPETAVALLKEAQDLMRKVEEGGEEIRRQVDEALARAQEALGNKEEAQRLVSQAETTRDPHEARVKLIEAQQHYPHYPDLETKIAEKERLVLAQVEREAATDLSEARGALARARGKAAMEQFDKAREHCRTALQRGANLSATHDALVARWEESQALLEEVGERETAYYDLLTKLERIDEALDQENVRLARNLMSQLTEEEQRDPETLDRRVRLADLEEDDEKYAEAERFYYREQDYERVIEVCKNLSDSADFRERARILRYRAEAHLWLGQAREAYQQGKLDSAIADYRRVEGLKNRLPDEDQSLVEEATTERRRSEQEKRLVADLRARLKNLADLRLQETVPWGQWLEEVMALKEAPPSWLVRDLEAEYETGVREWRDDACLQAERHETRGAISQAYELLKPLNEQGLLPADNPLWQQVQCSYYLAEAKRLASGYQFEQWEQAEEKAKDALDAAPMSQAPQVQTEFTEIVRQSILKRAGQVAAGVDPGPQGAVRILENKMERYPLLRRDSQIRARLIRYCLDSGNYDGALEHARTMAYVPSEERAAPFWEELVCSTRDFAEERWVQAIGSLVNTRRRGVNTGRVSESFSELHDRITERCLSQLRQEIVSTALAVSDDDVVTSVQTLDLILQLDPDDDQAQADLKALAGRLGDLVRPLRERATALRLGESLTQSLEEGVSLLMEVEALLRALAMVGKSGDLAAPLRRVESEVREQVERWRSAARALEQLESQWQKSVSGTWEIDTLQNHLDRAQHTLTGEVKEISLWEGRVQQLRTSTHQLTSLLQELRDCWNAEDFDEFISKASAVEGTLNETRLVLDEERFVIADKRLTFFDPFTQARKVGLNDLKQAAQMKRDNLAIWTAWQGEFANALAKVSSQWQQVVTWTTKTPPCLSLSVDILEELEQNLQTLSQKAEAQPDKPLSGKAKDIADRFPKAKLASSLTERQQETQEKLMWAREELEKVKEPLERVQKFARNTKRLGHPRNRQTLRQMLDEVKAIDACHPSVEGFEDLLGKYGD